MAQSYGKKTTKQKMTYTKMENKHIMFGLYAESYFILKKENEP